MSARESNHARERIASAPALLLETPDWLVVDKPADWHSVRGTTPAEADGSGVLEAWLAATRPELAQLPESGLVHRLDRDTSGCVVVARSRAAHADLARRFRTGIGVRKTYLARLRPGIAAAGDVELHFTSRYKRSEKATVARRGSSRSAGRVRWRVVARDDAHGDLVELELIGAGKRHQLRASCAHLGHPLVGDALYGGPDASSTHLHAWRIELDGVTIEAPAPTWARA